MKVAIAAAALALAAAQPENRPAEEIPVTSPSREAVAEVLRARNLIDNIRIEEATAALRKAIELDPGLAMAHALLATLLPAKEAAKQANEAMAAVAGLPESERVQVEVLVAGVRGENVRARELTARLVELAPGDWRAHYQLGAIALGDRNFPQATSELQKAIDLNPNAGGAYNLLGYSHIGQRNYDQAAAIFRKYAEVAPDEPNAHDSLAEALMNGGHLADAEVEFQKALAVRPKFAQAWTGIAETRLLRGDWAGGNEALEREREMDERPQAVLAADVNIAVARLAEGKAADCWKRLDAVVAKANQGQGFFTEVFRSRLLAREGRADESLKRAKAAVDESARSDLPDAAKVAIRRVALFELVRSQSLAGKKADVRRSVTALEEAVKPVVQNAFFASGLQNARGLAALARGNAADGVAAMKKCTDVDFNCLYDLVRAQRAAGDEAAAAATREAFLRTPLRGIEYVYLWKKMGGGRAVAGGAPGQR
jgi:Flp pilus assembly protein TadD